MKLKKRMIFAVIMFVILLPLDRLIYTSEAYPTKNWKIEPDTVLTYLVDYQDDSSLSTVIDDFASNYDFPNLDTNFFGEPKISLNITDINTSVSIEFMVSQFLNFSAPINSSQLENESWLPRTDLYFPLCVPINCWDDIYSNFSQKADEVIFNERSTEEAEFIVQWQEQDFHYSLTYVWYSENGGLIAIQYMISSDGSKDILNLSNSGKILPGDPPTDPKKIIGGLLTLATILLPVIGAVVGFFINKKKKKKEKNRNSMILKINHEKSYETSKFASKNNFDFSKMDSEEEDINRGEYELFVNQVDFRKNYDLFRKYYLIRWAIIQMISIFAAIASVKIGGTFETTDPDSTEMTLLFTFGVVALIILIIILNIPILKLDKIIKRNGFEKKFITNLSIGFLDISPMVIVILYFIIKYMIIENDYSKVTTIGGILVWIGLGVIFFGFMFGVLWYSTIHLFKTIKKKAFRVDYNFCDLN